MLSPRDRNALLLAVVLVGGLLRFGALGYGLPRHDLGQDEQITAQRVRYGVLRGNPGWPVFHWPNLNIHLSRTAVGLTRWLEAAAGLGRHDHFLIGRGLTAALCTLTLPLLYLIGARLFDPGVGLAAAGFLAVIPLHAFRSRLWVPDAPMTLFYTLALLAAVGILRRPSVARFVFAGVAVGLATATKYNGVGACLPVVLATVLAAPRLDGRRRGATLVVRLALAGAVSVIVFFAVNPLALSRFSEMLEGMRFVSVLYTDEPPAGFLGWYIIRYVAVSFFAGGYESVGALISALALAGWLLLLLRPSRAGLMAWLPGLAYLIAYSSVLRNAYERMFLPLTPHVALLAGLALVGGARELEAVVRRRWPAARLRGALIVVVLLLAALPVSGHVVAARHAETRVQAAQWMDDNLPAGSGVFREWDMILPAARRFHVNREAALLWTDGRTPDSVADRHDFVVTSSTTFDWVLRQRGRAVFDRRAAHYDELFDGPRFELAARFEPDRLTFGPEIRIFRSLPPRGRRLGPGKAYLDLQRTPWTSSDRLRAGRQQGLYRLEAPGDLIAGKARVRPDGRYALEITVEARPRATLEAGFGPLTRRLEVEGRRRLELESRLPAGQVWWWIEGGPRLAPDRHAVVSRVRLIRREADDGTARTEPESPLGDAPPEAMQRATASPPASN